MQPGLIEAFCDSSIPKTAATFTAAPSLSANVDAAIAEVLPGAVDPAGGIIGLGGVNSDGSYLTSPPSKMIAKSAVGTAVAKSGRTTGLSCGVVEGINGSVNIEYPPECGVPAHLTALFRGQVILNGIARPGDSGSLVVEAATARPLALIFGLSNDGQFVFRQPGGGRDQFAQRCYWVKIQLCRWAGPRGQVFATRGHRRHTGRRKLSTRAEGQRATNCS